MRFQCAADFFIYMPHLFIQVRKLMLQLMGSIHRRSLVFVRKEKPLKMQGRVNRIDLIAERLRHKIHQPHIICVFLTFMNHSIDGVVHIIHELVVVFVGHAPEPEFDVLKMHDVFQVIVQVRKRDYPIHRLLYAMHLRFQCVFFCPKNFNLFIQTVDGVHGILHRKPGLVGLPYRHFLAFNPLRSSGGFALLYIMNIHSSLNLPHQRCCRLQFRFIRIDFQIRPQIRYRFQLRQGVFQLDLILREIPFHHPVNIILRTCDT